MKIKRMLSRHRRDFTALYVCGHCGHEEKGEGYDDHHFHHNIIPEMICKKCGKAEGAITSSPSIDPHVTL